MPATVYHRVHLAAWDCLTPAGDAAASWRLVATNGCALRPDPEQGWYGTIPAGDRDLRGLLLATARMPWAAVAGRPGLPALGLCASKGDPWACDQALRGAGAALLLAMPDNISHHLASGLGIGLYRPCSVVAACSTGLYAALEAADLIERGQCTHALAGAVDGDLPPWLRAGFAALGVLCGSVRPRAFTPPATGFAPAPGAGVVALAEDGPWRLAAGVRLGDAGHPTHFSDPATLAHALEALWEVSPHPELIVTHGTGTAAGDAYELAGLEAGPWRRAARLHAKPAIGHSLGASGAVELAIACQAPVRRVWKLGLGFGGHLAVIAMERA